MDNEMFKTVLDFNKSHNLFMAKDLRILDLISEIGEVCKLEFSAKMTGKTQLDLLEEELGDCLYSLLSLFAESKISPTKALSKVFEKYSSRIEKNGNPESSFLTEPC